MNKILLTLALLLTAITTPLLGQETNHIKVSPHLELHFNEIVEIVEKNGCNVDWGKIDGVGLAYLLDNIQGQWSPDIDVILISYYFEFPPDEPTTREEKDDLVLLTLAHEIGHSQGLGHIASDKIGLMSPHSRFELDAIRTVGVEQYIIDCFKQLDK
jgi:hypothetical protein